MKKGILVLAIGTFLLSCNLKEKKEGFVMKRPKPVVKVEMAEAIEIPIDMNNKGVGPVKSVSFDAEIDAALAAKGQEKYSTTCVACHMANQRLIGPALAGVFDRRSPEWVMNMILNPDGMIKEDPIAKALLKEYNNAVMLNFQFTEAEARAVAEYLRTF
ncbi:cytochrome c [Arenibacter sp. GZD96]|uniref:c-type cytochrome n=1 Tax=Aurantibrevibacter litoralis TaxID=3106030 RepID=UPI002AFDCF9B|nr:cytochrome c [Arenibacter sp. GZD-96]MEA1785616.1 cytochrome c [Arenibacter sp. GZD-96]